MFNPETVKGLVDPVADRVRRSTSDETNARIDQETAGNIARHAADTGTGRQHRIAELDAEWDIERALEVNAASLMIVGLAAGAFVDRRWLALPAVVGSFLLMHGLQGWCPPLPLLRRLGFRTRSEIDEERYALVANSNARQLEQVVRHKAGKVPAAV